MNCYSCESNLLKPIKLDQGLMARQCSNCGGTHIDLLNYRAWREENADSLDVSADIDEVSASNTQKALICQRCSKIMLKYKISMAYENYVDICTSCDDAWLDGGEWNLLKHLHLQGKLTEITTEPWQRHIRDEAALKNFNDHYIAALGSAGFDKLRDIETWIAENDQKKEIMKYLRIRVGD